MVHITGLSRNNVQRNYLNQLNEIGQTQVDDLYDIANWVAALEKAAAIIKSTVEEDQEGLSRQTDRRRLRSPEPITRPAKPITNTAETVTDRNLIQSPAN